MAPRPLIRPPLACHAYHVTNGVLARRSTGRCAVRRVAWGDIHATLQHWLPTPAHSSLKPAASVGTTHLCTADDNACAGSCHLQHQQQCCRLSYSIQTHVLVFTQVLCTLFPPRTPVHPVYTIPAHSMTKHSSMQAGSLTLMNTEQPCCLCCCHPYALHRL
jgi:hypothetical protein